MTHEQKDLLLKDLCARLPYGVKIQSTDENIITLTGIILPNYYSTINGVYSFDCYPMKPYLFPLSSMTEEQYDEMSDILHTICQSGYAHHFAHKLIDWYNKNHFDYRGLIEKGLAIDATDKNIY